MDKITNSFKVFVDDNFHFMDESERFEKGEYETYEEAVEVCKKIIDQFLDVNYSEGMSAKELYDKYKAFGSDPFIVPKPEKAEFYSWGYAKKRCSVLCGKK